jgi:hypothetical protein
MTTQLAAAADWGLAPSLLEGAMTLDLDAASCNLRYWLASVPQGTLGGHVSGHDPRVTTPDYMLAEGPLREALSQEFAFRSIAEDKAARAIGYLVAQAPDIDTMEFYATQLLDEARHAMVFRHHLVELGLGTEKNISEVADSLAGADRDAILGPLEALGLEVLRDQQDFIGGVVTLTVLVEGVLAPNAELSERKWRPLDPAAADIEKGAGIDEIRHLAVGSAVAKDYLQRHPEALEPTLQLIARGMRLWDELPIQEPIYRRELLFQQGMLEHADVVGDYEIWPGRRMLDTSAEERLQTAQEWSRSMQETRLVQMGLGQALS